MIFGQGQSADNVRVSPSYALPRGRAATLMEGASGKILGLGSKTSTARISISTVSIQILFLDARNLHAIKSQEAF